MKQATQTSKYYELRLTQYETRILKDIIADISCTAKAFNHFLSRSHKFSITEPDQIGLNRIAFLLMELSRRENEGKGNSDE